MLGIDLQGLVEGLLCVGGDLQCSVEELLGGFAVDSIPDVLLSEIILGKNLLR